MLSYNRKIHWTEHSKIKMKQYRLSKTKLLNLLFSPERKERGIAPGTTAVMRTNKIYGKQVILLGDSGKMIKIPGEIWLMYKDIKDFRKIISAWRYPGISKPGEEIPVPEEIRRELLENNEL